MLRDGGACGGRDDRGGGGDVQRAGSVAAGSDDVDDVAAGRLHGKDVLAHRLRAAGDLVGRLSLGAQRDQESGDLGLRRLSGHDPGHHLARLLAAQAAPVRDVCDRVGDHERKFLAIAGPRGVRTLSGWNWTPSIGRSPCRTPMTSPSAVRDVTASTSGTLVAASEW